MLLVIFFIIITIAIIIIITAKVKLYITITKDEINLVLKFYILKKFLIKKLNLKNRKKSNIKNENINNLINNKKNLYSFIYKVIKQSHINLEKLKLKIDICTTDCVLTSYLVFIISNIITIFLKRTNLKIHYKNCSYKINPIFKNEKIFNIKLNCIISTNFVHTIFILYRNFRKWRCDKNGRGTPNRKPYDNCNEQHKRNDRCKYNNR